MEVVAAAAAAVFFPHQFRRTRSKRPKRSVRAVLCFSILSMSLSIASLDHFTLHHLGHLQALGIMLMFLSALLIISWCTLLSLNYDETAHPSFVHWSQWKKGKWIGSGSFGQVYLVSNRKSSWVKGMSTEHTSVRLIILQVTILLEINLLSQLSHPNIVQYYGSNLILSGLAYLHGRKIARRDIKGDNILVGPNDEVKLADFGLAKHISSVAAIHSEKGTSFWMVPEVIKSKFSGSGYNRLADIWSLGCTVIEMATGEHPWHEHCRSGEPCHHPIAGMFRAANSDDTPKIPESLSEEGKDFLRECLRRDPESRPTAAQLKKHPFVRKYFVVA